jgi:hypothetical protein
MRKSASPDQELFVSKQLTASYTRLESMFTLPRFKARVINKQVLSSYVVIFVKDIRIIRGVYRLVIAVSAA